MTDQPMPPLSRNPVSLLGAWATTMCAVLFLTGLVADLLGMHGNPYIGIFFFLVLPAGFVLGLLLIPLGVVLERRRRRRPGHGEPWTWPRVDLNERRVRRIVSAVALLTIVNVVVVSLAAFRGVEYMDSVPFCGQLCHVVMKPEFTAYQDGPHSRIACVQCHIGPGAPWFVKSKLSGTRQVFAVMLNTFPRPIPTPVKDLRPARDTCEQCHWPDKFHGDVIRVVREYASDEANSESTTTLRVHVGSGGTGPKGPSGIHWHVSTANRIEYIATDDKRQVIGYVALTEPSGAVHEYLAEGVKEADLGNGERRTLDCMDCHNRPTHPFAATAERALDGAMGFGELPRDLPFLRREAVTLLKAEYVSQDAAAAAIGPKLEQFYRATYPDVAGARRDEVTRAGAAVQRVYTRNVFPTMRVTWGTYPNNIGHADFPGCFRCHDDAHKTKDGRVIRQDCELCHVIE